MSRNSVREFVPAEPGELHTLTPDDDSLWSSQIRNGCNELSQARCSFPDKCLGRWLPRGSQGYHLTPGDAAPQCRAQLT